jgi:UPF0271 protein
MKIDLNADLGEGCGNDAALLKLVSSANIACGFHAGDAQTMRECVQEALKNGVAVGAHPSFPDRENFGRTAMQLPPQTVYAQTLYQCGALAAIVRAEGGVWFMSNRTACCITRPPSIPCWRKLSPARCATVTRLILVGLAGSELIRAAKHLQLTTREEVFADRGYQDDGTLVPRSQPGALITDDEAALTQTLGMVLSGNVKSINGRDVALRAQTVCLHGDGEHALAFARRLREAFDRSGIVVSAEN